MGTILYVHSTSGATPQDNTLISRLTTAGHTVVSQAEDVDPTSNLASADGCIIASAADATDTSSWTEYAATYRAFTGGIATFVRATFTRSEPHEWSALHLSGGDITVSTDTTVSIEAAGHPLAAGKTGQITVFDGVGATVVPYVSTGHGGTFPDGPGEFIAIRGTSSGRWALFGYEPGATLTTGTAAGRRVASFLRTQNLDGWTDNGLDLFDATVEWIVDGEAETGTPLDTPTNFTFTAHGSLRQLDGSWSAVSGAESYDWEVEVDDGGYTAFGSGSTAGTSFQLDDGDGVDWQTNYRGRVRANPEPLP